MVVEEKALVCFLGEKWFYTTGHQRNLKHLTQVPQETEGVDHVKRPRVLICRFNVKVMYLGVAA